MQLAPSSSPRAASTTRQGNSEKPQIQTARTTSTKWSAEEHNRYVSALALYPNCPWKIVAEIVGTRTVRQVMSHAQKIAQKEQRHIRGLKPAGRPRRIAPVSPTSVADVAMSTASGGRQHRRQRHSPSPYEREGFAQWGLHDHDIVSDEEYNAHRLYALAQAEEVVLTLEHVLPPHEPAASPPKAAYNGPSQWSEEDLEWFAELSRLNGWAEDFMVTV